MSKISAKYLIGFVFICSFFHLKAQQIPSKVEKKIKGSENSEIYYELDGQKNGLYTFYYQKNKRIEGNYLKDKKDGAWIYYNAEGKCIIKGRYSNDKQEGDWLYFKNDTLISRITYNSITKIDTLRGYLPNGELIYIKIEDNSNPQKPITQKDSITKLNSPYTTNILPVFLNNTSDSFREYIQKNRKYPENAANEGIRGRVYIQFTISPLGKVEDVYILRGLSKSLDKEAIRVVESSPNWEPGYQFYVPVKVQFTFPVNFIQ